MNTSSSTPPSRILTWEASLNTRELGGYPLQSGGRTRWGALVRSETLALLTPAGQQALLDYGIRTIIDLRFPAELETAPNPFDRPKDGRVDAPDFTNIPLDHDENIVWHATMEPAELMADMYCRLLETNHQHAAAALSAIARARPGGVLFHCHAGKDRTGLIAALVLGAVGADAETIVADYAFSSPPFVERRLRWLSDPDMTPENRAYLGLLSSAMPETMRLTLNYLDSRYGGVEGYLRTTPLPPEDLKRLRERLVEPLL